MPIDSFPLIRGNLQGTYRDGYCNTFSDCYTRDPIELLKLQADSVVQGKKDGYVKKEEENIFFNFVKDVIDQAIRDKVPLAKGMNYAVRDKKSAKKRR